MGGYLAVSLLCLYLITQSACTLSKDDQSACRLPMQTGPCKAAFPRFFYDTGDGTCKLFLYGGCEGNENNFLSKADCERLCLAGTTPGGRVTSLPLTTPSSISPSSADRVCQLPAESGLCLGYFPYYFFNAQVGECQEFIYGGCGGNENRFATKQECENQCRSSYVARTLPPSTDVCSLPKAAGMCDAYFPAFFYNSATGECEFFVYGGCQGNANRFDTLAACEQRCKETKTTTETTITNANRCTLPAAPGVCKAYVPSFYFDFQTGQCKSFVYGGCGGNANRFATIEQCQKACPGGKKKQRISAICLQPKLVGPCRAAFPRFYYNQSSGQCESFVYGGCSGNQNNFRSYDDCVRRCNQ